MYTKFYEITYDKTLSEKKAIAYAKERNALYVAAMQNGYQVTDEQVKAYVEELKQNLDGIWTKEQKEKLLSGFASEDDIINYILDERQIELVGEGRRWFDLLRTKKWKEVMEPINGMNQDGNELFPIHYSHINENPKLTQNPYYGK